MDLPGVTFGLYPFPQGPPFATLVARMRHAEELGLDGVWVADETPMAFPGVIGYEAWSLLGALARETKRVTLGTLVTPVALRHPLLLAMCVTTVDHASNGRAVLGLGAGGVPEDLAGIGQEHLSPAQLVESLEEQLSMVDALLRGETVNRSDGRHRTREAVVEAPIQRPRPPLLVAAQGRRAIGVAARHADIWNTLGGQPMAGDRVTLDQAVAATRRQVDLLDDACAAAGRDPATVRRSVFAWRHDLWASPDAFAEWVGRYLELGFADFVAAWPSARGSQSATERESVMERVAADVMPRLRRR